MTGLLHDLRARIIVLVDPMAEAHEAEWVVLVFGTADVFRDAFGFADLAQHVQCGLIGAAMRGAPKACAAGRNTGEGIGPGGTGKPDRGGRGILLVVGMQDEDAVHRAGEDGIGLSPRMAPRSTCVGNSSHSRGRSSDR